MSHSIVPFSFENQSVRVVVRDGDSWFVVKDLCEVLHIKNSRDAISRLDADEKDVALTYTLGGAQQVQIVNESGLYTLILRCRDAIKPGSVSYRFRKWVTSEVLPSIRKTGSYSHQGTVLDDYQLYQVFFVLSHFTSLYKIYKSSHLYDHLKGLGSRIGIEMYDHFRDGMAGGVRQLDKSLASQFEAACKRLRVHYISQKKRSEEKYD